MELVTPRALQEVKQAILGNDRTTFAKYGRFLHPITARIVAESSPAERPLLEQRSSIAYASHWASLPSPAACR
jgi:hypothetical protein